MRRTNLIAVSAICVLALAIPAGAKGAFEATITGPGVDEPIYLDGTQDIRLQDGRLEDLLQATSFWDLAYTFEDSPHRAGITMIQPTDRLGPEFVARVGHAGPGGPSYVDVLLYPEAEGGPLAFVEPGVEVEAMRATTSGGWYSVRVDLSALLEGYGVDMARAMSDATPTKGPGGVLPDAGWLVPIGLIVALGAWAIGRRPRRRLTS